MAVTIHRTELPSPVADALILTLNAELLAMYPEPGATHFRLDPEEVRPGRGAFLIAYRNEVPLGCGAVRLIDAATAEVKRMYVVPEARGRGIGRALVGALEREAAALGATRLVLETGVRQAEAIGLYRRMGFTDIPPYGEYTGSRTSICMARPVSYSSST